MTITAPHPATDQSTDARELDTIVVRAWLDPATEAMPGAIPTDSDDALVTGTGAIFDSCECALWGVR